MLKTGTKKVIRDLLQEKRRTLTVLLAMIIGVFAVAMMSTAKSLLDNNLTENFLRTNPASFSLFVPQANDSVLDEIRSLSSIEQVTTRQSVWIRMKKDDGTFRPVLLYVVNDVHNPLISTYTIDEGALPLCKNEIVIERTGKKLENLEVNQSLDLLFPGYTEERYILTGFTHDAGIAPSWMEGYLYGYISASALPKAYLAKFATEIECTVSDNKFSLKHIEQVAEETKTMLEQKGVAVKNTEMHEPGVHRHQKQMNALMFLILNFGILTLILSCFLIINMISAIMAKEIRQIAIMKSVGASSLQIARIYISTILLMAAASIVVGTPLGIVAGRAFATFNASMLNFELFNTAIEPKVLLLIVLAGICLPVIMSVFPILKSGRVSVQSALNNTGVENVLRQNHIFSILGQWFSGSFLLAFKNTFRRKTRLWTTVLSLSIGGAIFITAFNIRESTNNTIDSVFDKQPQDMLFALSKPYHVSKIDSALQAFEIAYQLGFRSEGSFVQSNGISGNPFVITAIEDSGKLIFPVITEGRWVQKGKNELVINQVLLNDTESLRIGDMVNLSINGLIEKYTLVGVCKEMFSQAGLFMEKSDYARHLNRPTDAGNLLIVDALTDNQKEISALDVRIEKALKSKQISIVNSITKAAYKTAVVEHLLIIMAMLLIMTMLVIIVGGMGMATSMNINVSERIYELGILRAIGILNKDIRVMLVNEAVTISLLSWILAIILAMPLSSFLGNQFFSIFFESSMTVVFSHFGIGVWLALGVVIAVISSMAPAKRVIKMQITESLKYE